MANKMENGKLKHEKLAVIGGVPNYIRSTWSIHVDVLQRTAKKGTKIYNTRAH